MSEPVPPQTTRPSAPARSSDSAARGPRSAADVGAEVGAEGGRGLGWWARLLLVLAFEAVSALAVWWALNPDASSSTANPGTVPTFLAVVAVILFVLVGVQVTSKVPLWTVALAVLLVVPALVAGERAADGLALLSADRVPGGNVSDVQTLTNGMHRAKVALEDGRSVTVYSSIKGKRGTFYQSNRAKNFNKAFLQLETRPFKEVTGDEDVVVGGPTYARLVTGDALSPADRTRNWVWLGVATLLWLPIQAGAISALVRRRGWWQRLGDKEPADEVLPG
ncbi:hypothetical protein ABEG17_01200 [Pedococcus sp. KACC 23699]|uniref:Uncharacterized protein n=1 Tax=Pedococcus sp. KACC 23699 TaxID=3149228 RepID=A0AAU7JUP8_9MICO